MGKSTSVHDSSCHPQAAERTCGTAGGREDLRCSKSGTEAGTSGGREDLLDRATRKDDEKERGRQL